jgi:hypothetical protein
MEKTTSASGKRISSALSPAHQPHAAESTPYYIPTKKVKSMPQKLLLLAAFLSCCCILPAQKVLQLEKYGSPKTQKIHIGEVLTYRLAEDDHFTTAYLEDIRVEEGLLQMGEYYVKVDDIVELRYERRWAKAAGSSLFWFGIGWSGFSFLGNTFDGDNTTNYGFQDAGLTLTAIGFSYLIPRLFKYKRIKIGARKRLRPLDLRFRVEDWED